MQLEENHRMQQTGIELLQNKRRLKVQFEEFNRSNFSCTNLKLRIRRERGNKKEGKIDETVKIENEAWEVRIPELETITNEQRGRGKT